MYFLDFAEGWLIDAVAEEFIRNLMEIWRVRHNQKK